MAKIAWKTKLLQKQLTIGVLGAKRSGKTYWIANTALPKLVENGIPAVVFDMVGGMVDHVKRNKTAFIIEVNAVNSSTILMAQQIIQKTWEKKQVVLFDMGGLLQEDKANFLNIMSRWIWKSGIKDGCIVVDEIHEVLGQVRGRYSPEFERLVRQGGNHGLAFIYSTQRPASVDKMVWLLTDVMVCFRVTYDRDQEIVQAVLKTQHGKEKADAVSRRWATMATGEHIILVWTKF